MLFKDPQVHHKILQLSVRRFRHLYRRFQLHQQTSKIKLIKTLIKLAENYGKSIEEGAEILQIPHQDLADVADISLDECEQIITQLKHQGCLESDSSRQLLFLTNLKQLNHFAKQI